MAKDDAQWFRRARMSELADLECPRCAAKHRLSTVFDHAPNPCPQCGAILIEWSLSRCVYVFDAERAPGLVAAIQSYVAERDEIDAFGRLQELVEFLCFQ